MGWNQDTKQITTFNNSAGVPIDIVKNYGQIDKATLKTACERFCKMGEVNAEACLKQNNMMMSMCLMKLLTVDAKVCLLTNQAKYMFNGVEYARSGTRL